MTTSQVLEAMERIYFPSGWSECRTDVLPCAVDSARLVTAICNRAIIGGQRVRLGVNPVDSAATMALVLTRSFEEGFYPPDEYLRF